MGPFDHLLTWCARHSRWYDLTGDCPNCPTFVDPQPQTFEVGPPVVVPWNAA